MRIKDEDQKLFRRTVGKVQPVKCDRLHLHPDKKPRPVPKRRLPDVDAPLDPSRTHDVSGRVGVGDALSYTSPGLRKDILKKIRRGFFDIEAEVDLHGLTEREAKRRLLTFLHFSLLDGLRCVRVIHGKGYRSPQGNPVLKNTLNLWLRQHAHVLAFCSCNPVDGGTGALYVLLASA